MLFGVLNLGQSNFALKDVAMPIMNLKKVAAMSQISDPGTETAIFKQVVLKLRQHCRDMKQNQFTAQEA